MAKTTDKSGILYQNLIDCGCDKETVNKCLNFAENGCAKKMAVLLRQKRCEQLNTLHKEQEKLECIDFLLYRIGKGDFEQ